jgi:PEP-CTERM motif
VIRCLKTILMGLVTCLVGVARAEAGTLYIGGTDGTFINITVNGNSLEGAGGNFQPNTLDGTPLTYLYCVSATTDIYVPGTFTSNITTNGMVDGQLVNNGGQIAWLLTNLASSATTGDLESGLQSAIWSVIYGKNFTLGANNPLDVIHAYNADLTALGNKTAPVSDLIWLSNYDPNGNVVQPFVSLNPNPVPSLSFVPEPSSFVLAGTGLAVCALALLRRRLRRLAGAKVG